MQCNHAWITFSWQSFCLLSFLLQLQPICHNFFSDLNKLGRERERSLLLYPSPLTTHMLVTPNVWEPQQNKIKWLQTDLLNYVHKINKTSFFESKKLGFITSMAHVHYLNSLFFFFFFFWWKKKRNSQVRSLSRPT